MNQSEITDNKLQEFVRDACPAAWLEYGEELKDSAELIWTRNDDLRAVSLTKDSDHNVLNDSRVSPVSRTYMLLAGFSLENLLKGLLIAGDPTLINRGELKRLKSHDIVSLAAKIPGLKLSPQELKFCKKATTAIPYWGRYPIPLNRSDLLPEVGVDLTLRQAFLGLFDRLAHKLYWATRDGWDSGVGPATIKVRSMRYGDSFDLGEPL